MLQHQLIMRRETAEMSNKNYSSTYDTKRTLSSIVEKIGELVRWQFYCVLINRYKS